MENEERKRTGFAYFLRIAFSAACGIACVLLLALWVRSYLYHDRLLIRYASAGHVVGAVSAYGAVAIGEGDTPDLGDRPYVLFTKTARQSPIETLGPRLALKAASRGDWYLNIPLWLLVIISVIGTAAPWYRWHFRVRTLLIATAVVAGVLGIIAISN